MRTSHKIAGAMACVASLAFATPAFACGQEMGRTGMHGGGQGMGGMGMHGGGQGMGGMGMHGGGKGMGGMGTHGEHAAAGERLASLKTELKITAAQEPAWNAFAAKAAKQAEGMQALREKMRDGAATAPDRFAQRAEIMKQRVAGMEGIATTLKDLYAAFTPEQKALADKRFGARGPGVVAWNGSKR